MSTAAVAARAPRERLGVRASLSRNRRWALITSYVFLVIFAIFFLIPTASRWISSGSCSRRPIF
jgi:multiple sugar transport system permease protein